MMVAVRTPHSKSDKNWPTPPTGQAPLGAKPEHTTGFSLTNIAKKGVRIPTLPFLRIKDRVLGKRYSLSLVIAGDTHTRGLNRLYRKKGYIPNVLSFPLDPKNGEVILNLDQAKRDCRVREESLRFFVALLFIHSLLHLKGYHHGGIMERHERALLSLFHIKNTLPPMRGRT